MYYSHGALKVICVHFFKFKRKSVSNFTPYPVGLLLVESQTGPAISIWAHLCPRSVPTNSSRNSAAVIDPPPLDPTFFKSAMLDLMSSLYEDSRGIDQSPSSVRPPAASKSSRSFLSGEYTEEIL